MLLLPLVRVQVLDTGTRVVCGVSAPKAWTRAGFRLDTLLKLADVKGTDRRTSLLHFVLAQLVAAEGAGVAALAAQLAAVRPAANLQARAAPRSLESRV